MTVDYIQWELLRQRERFVRLLSGGTAEDPEKETAPAPETAENAVPIQAAAERAHSGTDAPEDGGAGGTETGTPPAADSPAVRNRRAGTASVTGEIPAAGDGLPGGEVLAVLPGGETPAESLASARAVSRCAERDARRYDGGYPLY